MKYQLGFVGAGNMAEAIALAAINSNIVDAAQIIASDPSDVRRDLFASHGITTTDDNGQVLAEAANIVLAIKPQTLPQMSEQLAQLNVETQVLISIMAGIRSSQIVDAAGKPVRVVRVMPNTPLLAGAGMAGIALGAHAKAGDDGLAMQLFGAAGKAVAVSEEQLDAITAVSGSGPAYLFYLAQAMQEAAEEMGLGEHADLLVSQTLFGASKLLCESPDTPAELRRKVTSPGGTTAAAIEHMESNAVRQHIQDAIGKARDRSIELGS